MALSAAAFPGVGLPGVLEMDRLFCLGGRGVSTRLYSGVGGEVISSASPVKFSDGLRPDFGVDAGYCLKGDVDLREDGRRTGESSRTFFDADFGDFTGVFFGVTLGDCFGVTLAGVTLGDFFGVTLGEFFTITLGVTFAGVTLDDFFGVTLGDFFGVTLGDFFGVTLGDFFTITLGDNFAGDFFTDIFGDFFAAGEPG